MMDAKETQRRAKELLAKRWGTDAAVFDGRHNVFIHSESVFFEMLMFGGCAVFYGNHVMMDWCSSLYAKTPGDMLFDGEKLFDIEQALRAQGYALTGEHVRYLRLAPPVVKKPEGFAYTLYEQNELSTLSPLQKAFPNALNGTSDVMAMTAERDGNVVSMAAADDDYGRMLQVGIDTIPSARRQGLGAYLVSCLADAIEARDMIPFYTTWSANIGSSNVAIAAGFRPMWVYYCAEKGE